MSGCRSVCADLCELIRDFGKMFAETRSLLLPVVLTIGLTQCLWFGIYDCQVTRNLFFYDSGSVWDGLANAGLAMLVIALVSVLMITLAIFHYKKIVKAWLALSSVAVSFFIAGAIFQDAVALLPGIEENTQLAIVAALIAAYGGGSVMAFFTQHLPTWFHQLYVITNCTAIATFYLTVLPGSTAWFLLAAIAGWDVFAVLAPCGPLKIALERSQDYGADVLRFVMFTARSEGDEVPQPAPSAVDAAPEPDVDTAPAANDDGSSGDDDCVVVSRPTRRLTAGADQEDSVLLRETMQAMVEEEQQNERNDNGAGDSSDDGHAEEARPSSPQPASSEGGAAEGEKNAREALNEGSHLGFGDFIFFSLLVGRSMAVGLLPALSSTCGVIIGLAYTLNIKHDGETLPALPISIACGMFGHFFTVAQMTAIEFLYDSLAF